jgi:transcription antitermination factor NusG
MSTRAPTLDQISCSEELLIFDGGSISQNPAELPWFAIRVRPRYEKQVAQSIESKSIHTFLPLYAARHRWSDRTKEVHVPLFDGYVFCQLDPCDRMPVLVTPGVFQFVGIGKIPVPVEPCEIAALQAMVQFGSVVRPWPFLKDGERVRIDDGPLRSTEGILLRGSDSDQVVVSVTLLQRSVAVKVDRAWITPIRPWMRKPAAAETRSEEARVAAR